MNTEYYRLLYRIRRVEEEIARIYPTDKIISPVHLSIGQEAASVGICAQLLKSDVVFGTYRCHAMYLAKGGDLKKMIAELYGKATGCAKGKAGSMHLVDKHAGVMGASAVVSTTIPIATGYALSYKMRQQNNIVVCFFGDGAVEEGVFHESLNFAQLKKLPILFVCENNQYAIHSKLKDRQPETPILAQAKSYGIPSTLLNSHEFEDYVRKSKEEIETVRSTGEPRFLEVMCYRWKEHVGPNEDFHIGYRTVEEARPWIASDPVSVLGNSLPLEVKERIDREEEALILDAFDYGESSPFPEDHELYTDLFSN